MLNILQIPLSIMYSGTNLTTFSKKKKCLSLGASGEVFSYSCSIETKNILERNNCFYDQMTEMNDGTHSVGVRKQEKELGY